MLDANDAEVVVVREDRTRDGEQRDEHQPAEELQSA